jgi:hypothetical protein
MDVPRRAFFQKRRQGRQLGSVLHLGDVAAGRGRGHCTVCAGHAARKASVFPPARTARKAHARLVLLLSYYRPRVHVAFICTAAEATQARSRLGIGWRGVGRRGIWAVTQAGKQEHELLPLQDGSEDSCRQAELGELSVCLRCRRHALILPMRRRSLQGCSKAPLATGCDRGQAAEAA